VDRLRLVLQGTRIVPTLRNSGAARHSLPG
jgi:hypothetical protein